LVYCLGLFVLSVGITVSVNSNLGVAPISSLPYVLSRIFPFTMGTFSALMFITFVLIQILILRREFKWISLSQLLIAALAGYFIDLTNFLLRDFRIPTYFGQMTMLWMSIFLLASGISLLLEARFLLLPTEETMSVIAKKINRPFHRLKIILDCTIVSLSIAFSLLFLHGLVGVREGTVLTALFVGRIIPYTRRATKPLARRLGL